MNTASGVMTRRADLIRFLQSIGHDITVVSAADDTIDELRDLRVSFIHWPVSRRGINLFAEGRSLLSLRCILSRLQPQIMLCFTQKAILYGSIAARTIPFCSVFSVFAGLGFLFSEESRFLQKLSPIVRSVFRFALKQNPVVFFQNPDDLDLFVAHRIVAKHRTCRLYGSGVDTVRFTPSRNSNANTTTYFLMISRLIVPKGVLDFIQAASILKDEGYDAHMMLLGPFDDHPNAIDPATIRSSEQSGVIEYLGTTSDVRPYLDSADVFVLPSYYREGTPRSTLEAMAMAKPIITTDSPGCRETVIHNENGYIVPAREPKRLAGAMKELIGNRRLLKKMGHRSRSLAIKRYDIHKVNAEMWSAIKRALS